MLDKKISVNNLFVGSIYDSLNCEMIESIFRLNNGEYIDLLSNNRYKQQFMGDIPYQEQYFISRMVAFNCVTNNEINKIKLSVLKKTIICSQNAKGQKDKELKIIPSYECKTEKNSRVYVTYLNPFHSSLDKNIKLIKNAPELEKIRIERKGGVLLDGIALENGAKESISIVASYCSESVNEPFESRVYRNMSMIKRY